MFERTRETMTCGIVNIPLTKSARLFFYVDNNNGKQIIDLFESLKVPYDMIKLPSGRIQIISKQEIESKQIKNVFHSFKTLRPKLESQWRYVFWEIDNQELDNLNFVSKIYRQYKLPYYCHKSMRGYHFLSVKPIEKELWHKIITELRPSNLTFPPVTLRFLANKYYHELHSFRDGYVVSENNHTDTEQLRKYINNQNIPKMNEHYFVVWYDIPPQEKLDEMSIEERTTFQDNQI